MVLRIMQCLVAGLPTCIITRAQHTRCDNKVRELATVCLPCSSGQKSQYGLITLANQRLLLSECVLACHHENVGASC
jgi:hypothetical protein